MKTLWITSKRTRSKRVAIVLVLATTITLPSITTVRAAPGDLDSTFGAPNGFVLLPDSVFADMVIQPADGKILAAGSAVDNGTLTNLIVARFNTDGTLDSGFGAGGIALGPTASRGRAVALQPDGKIVASGALMSGEAVIARFETDGTIDAGFGQNGFAIHSGVPAFEVAIGPGNTIALVDFGIDFGSGEIELFVARLDANGDLDRTFGNGGIVSTENGFGFDIAVLGDGRILVAGSTGDFALWRYNTNGTLDTTFGGGDGVATAAFPSISFAAGLAVQTDGRILLAGGSGGPNSNPRVPAISALARFDSQGNLDQSFDADGKVTATVAGAEVGFSDVAVQSDGAIVAAGTAVTGPALGDRHALVSRFTPIGSPDSSFGAAGSVVTNFPGESADPLGVRIQSDGKIVIAGEVFFNGSDSSGLVARYNGSGAPPPPPPPPAFDICIQKNTLIFKFNSTTGAYEFRDCHNNVVLTGTGHLTPNFCKLTLTDLGPAGQESDRNINVKVNTCTKAGAATISIVSPSKSYNFTDSDITQGSCTCP